MKKRMKIILISTAAAVLLLAGVLIWLWYDVSEPRRLGVESSFKFPEAETVFGPAEFGESDDPAIIALGKAVENGLLVPRRSPDCWRLIASDESISLDLMDYGDIWHLCAAIQMEPFFTAGLSQIWWNSGGFAFDQMRAAASSFFRGYSLDGLCLLPSDWWSKAEKDRPLPELLSSLTDQINPENVAFRQTEPGWYGIDLEVYNDDRSGRPRVRFADDGSALEFVLDAGFYRKGRLDLAKLQGWEYDAEADTLAKRYTVQ